MFCEYCGASLPEGARFCPACGKPPRTAASAGNRCPACGAAAGPGDAFCGLCGAPLRGQTANEAAPRPVQTCVPVPGSVPKQMTGRRVIAATRPFTHEELLRFMTERWDTAAYNRFVTDPAMSQYTKQYVVLPATPRYMVIVFSRAAGSMLSKENKVVLSVINSPAGAGEMLMRSIPTQNAFFGIAKISNTMSSKAEREGPAEEILQRYADYMYALLREAGYAR